MCCLFAHFTKETIQPSKLRSLNILLFISARVYHQLTHLPQILSSVFQRPGVLYASLIQYIRSKLPAECSMYFFS